MRLTITYTDSRARDIRYFLRRKYNSKAELPKLIRKAVQNEVYLQAKKESDEATLAVAEGEADETR